MSKLSYVNIEIGTDSDRRMSNGNLLPNVALPFAMHGYTLESKVSSEDPTWFYSPYAKYCEGIRVTQQPSPWIMDYGFISMLPFTKEDVTTRQMRYSAITKKNFAPDEMEIEFHRYMTNFKLSPTKNGFKALVKNSWDEKTKLLIDLGEGTSKIAIHENEINLEVSNFQNDSNPLHKQFKKFYNLVFSNEISTYRIFDNHEQIVGNVGNNLVLILEFNKSAIEVSASASYIDNEQAKQTNVTEVLNYSYEEIKTMAQAAWDDKLNLIDIEDSEENKKVFYSNMYRAFLFPHNITEINKNGEEVYKDFHNDDVKHGFMISDIGFWDAYKTSFPLYSILVPDYFKKMVGSLISTYKNTGWLPRWLAPFEVGCMPSTLTDSVICEAITKRLIDDEDIETAIEALIKNAETNSNNELFGREAIEEYKQLGYLSFSGKDHCVSSTLDYAYTDHVLSVAFNQLSDFELSQKYEERSMNYKKIFNPENHFFVAKDIEGKFREDFSPYDWGWDYCEAAAWQNSFTALHDISGLIELYGSRENAIKRLDDIFTQYPAYNVGRYEEEIHEQLEMGVVKLGQFAISNQPSFHLPHIYHVLGEYESFSYWMNKTFDVFNAECDGYPGDEDNGSMSSWYILNTIGIYSLDPVSGEFLQFPSKYKNVKLNLKDSCIYTLSMENEYKTVNYFDIMKGN